MFARWLCVLLKYTFIINTCANVVIIVRCVYIKTQSVRNVCTCCITTQHTFNICIYYIYRSLAMAGVRLRVRWLLIVGMRVLA